MSVEHGALSVMIGLISMMPQLSVGSWDSLRQLEHTAGHTLDKEVAIFGLMTFAVVAVKVHHFTALIVDLEFITADILKMLVFGAHVSQTH